MASSTIASSHSGALRAWKVSSEISSETKRLTSLIQMNSAVDGWEAIESMTSMASLTASDSSPGVVAGIGIS